MTVGRRETIAFIEDDYERARSTASSQHRPLFVDAWATWCHTCLSMREYVFNDPALAPERSWRDAGDHRLS
jgi:thiol:disulfide interchange protein